MSNEVIRSPCTRGGGVNGSLGPPGGNPKPVAIDREGRGITGPRTTPPASLNTRPFHESLFAHGERNRCGFSVSEAAAHGQTQQKSYPFPG